LSLIYIVYVYIFHKKIYTSKTDSFIYTFEELKWHACHFILSKWQSFTDLYEALRADSNLQWSKPMKISSIVGKGTIHLQWCILYILLVYNIYE